MNFRKIAALKNRSSFPCRIDTYVETFATMEPHPRGRYRSSESLQNRDNTVIRDSLWRHTAVVLLAYRFKAELFGKHN